MTLLLLLSLSALVWLMFPLALREVLRVAN